ncbi:hypothetical protein AB0H86_32840 [Streptomyces sp. NPDC050997]|uniref:hypothetical protein n=1 Tax=Streptomyces sp. NPDC050997 TaxID=3155519 RepID=UPI0034429666
MQRSRSRSVLPPTWLSNSTLFLSGYLLGGNWHRITDIVGPVLDLVELAPSLLTNRQIH